ncbi:DUF4129 domain-containing protein [Caulobacter sp. 17J80-11]|uniref:DUF4129 domain-containing protein n=1 Tax=Caulobacter sp. 17J80-11 TaxID=2763502 RepID=UPI00351C4C34
MASASQVKQGAVQGDAVARAHEQMLADKSLQFDLKGFDPPKVPEWLQWLGELFRALAPVLKVLFYVGLAAGVGLILYFVGRELIRLHWGGRGKVLVLNKGEPAVEWRPDAAVARTLLEDADRLAGEGRFAEAVRLLLFRSIEDIQGRRPHAVKPAQTTRDIAALDALPASARPAFAKIGEAVERSFFGGRPVDAETFADCRQAYEAFALPGGWSA